MSMPQSFVRLVYTDKKTGNLFTNFLVVQKAYTNEIEDINRKQNPGETITRAKKKRM